MERTKTSAVASRKAQRQRDPSIHHLHLKFYFHCRNRDIVFVVRAVHIVSDSSRLSAFEACYMFVPQHVLATRGESLDSDTDKLVDSNHSSHKICLVITSIYTDIITPTVKVRNGDFRE